MTQLSRGLGPNPDVDWGRGVGLSYRYNVWSHPATFFFSPFIRHEDGNFFLQIKQFSRSDLKSVVPTKHESYSTNPATQPEYLFFTDRQSSNKANQKSRIRNSEVVGLGAYLFRWEKLFCPGRFGIC